MKRKLLAIAAFLCVLLMNAAQPSGTLPVLYIQTEGNAPITSKETYLNATYYLESNGFQDMENIGSAEAPLTLQIKGRGNYTWTSFEKKPYRLKLTEKAPLCGLEKSKHFAVLAHADDTRGFMRDVAGFEASRLVGLEWTPEDRPIELVINGDYLGLYFLTELIRVDKKRVNVTEQADESNDDVTGGWLVEKDNYSDDPHVTINENGTNMWITYKSPEVLTSEQSNYLKGQFQTITDLLYAGTEDSSEWERMLDMDQAARFYVVQEIMDNYESYHGSCYLHKEKDGEVAEKWKFGPVWDFGSSLFREKSSYCYEDTYYTTLWIKQLRKYPAFNAKVIEVWNEFLANGYYPLLKHMEEYAENIAEAAICDADRWEGKYDSNRDLLEKGASARATIMHNVNWLISQWGGEIPEDPDSFKWTVAFQDNVTPAWDNLMTYTWHMDGGNVVQHLGGWPGTAMSGPDAEGVWTITFYTKEDISDKSPMIIFNDGKAGVGTHQTKDLKFENGMLYNRDGVVKEISGITSVDADAGLKISGARGVLTIISDAACDVRITDLAGRSWTVKVNPGTNEFMQLAPGFYIVGGKKVVL